MSKILTQDGLRDVTTEEQAVIDARLKEWNDNKLNRQILEIRQIRNQKLIETDYLALSDNTMPDNIKTWRQSLRDLPQNNTTEAEYDALLARDSDGNLTNSIWSKP
jgi:helix-turn-helix protein